MILLDTSVLVYAVGEEHALRDPCRRLLAAHGGGVLEAATTIGVIAEFTYVRARRRTRADASALGRAYLAALPIVDTTDQDLGLALELFARHDRLNMLEAVLAAVAIGADADALVSADRGFRGVPRLRWVDPGSSDLDVLLTGKLALGLDDPSGESG